MLGQAEVGRVEHLVLNAIGILIAWMAGTQVIEVIATRGIRRLDRGITQASDNRFEMVRAALEQEAADILN